MAVTSWLIDKSAYVRMQLGQAARAEQWNTRVERGLVRLSTVTRLELGLSARSGHTGREAFNLPSGRRGVRAHRSDAHPYQ